MRTNRIVRVSCVALLSLALAGCSGCLGLRRRPVVVVLPPAGEDAYPGDADGPREAPPPPCAEERPRAPSAAHVWVAGHWGWRAGRYVWVSGHWLAPARRGSLWVSGRWERHGRHYIWVEGHWR